MILIESDDNNSDNKSDNDDNNNTSENDGNYDNHDNANNGKDNELPVNSPHEGPKMLSFDVHLLSLKTTVEFPVVWDVMSLT